MSRRKPEPEMAVHPEELMMVESVMVGGVMWAGILVSRWWFCGVNTGGEYICALSPKGYEDPERCHEWVEDHLLRIRQWLRENPEPEEVKQTSPVDRLWARRRRLWEAVLATWNREQVEMATDSYGPLGCFNDDTPGTPFTKERCRQLIKEEAALHHRSGGRTTQEAGVQ